MGKKVKKTKNEVGRPELPITEAARKLYISLIKLGETDNRAAKLCAIDKGRWIRLREKDKDFAALYEKAANKRAQLCGKLLRTVMLHQVAAGSIWWARLMIANYRVFLKDPDLEAKRAAELDKAAIAAEARTLAEGTEEQ